MSGRWSSTFAAQIALGMALVALAAPVRGQQADGCDFGELKFPENLVVFAGGEYAGREVGFQIDQSGHEATQMDVVVNSPDRPVALILGAYEPTIWHIQWTRGTRILAVVIGGYHRQGVAGVPKSLPVSIRAHDDGSDRNESRKCGYFYISRNDMGGLNPLSRKLFNRNVEMVYLAKKGALVIGNPPAPGTALETSQETTVASYRDQAAPLAGPAGLADAVAKGLLRPATARDIQDWEDAVIASTPDADVPPVAGQPRRSVHKPMMHNAYVVLKPFRFPAGLYGGNLATFIVPRGVPRPEGNPGHSGVYDFNTLACSGAMCEKPVMSAPRTTTPKTQPALQPATPATPSARTSSASGGCSARSSTVVESSCLAVELRRTDDDINNVYRAVMAALAADAKSNLRAQQRAWLKARDAECRIDTRATDRNAWLAYVVEDKARAVCVVRVTEERLAYLNDLKIKQAAAPAEPFNIEARVKPARSSQDYATASRTTRDQGKWYFEVRVDHGKIRGDLEASLFLGISAAGETFGHLYHIRPQDLVLEMPDGGSVTIVGGNLSPDISLPAVTTGIAIDLDNGKLYSRRDNVWRNGVPGSAAGTDVKLGRAYRAEITSSVPLADLVSLGIVTINFGARPFEGTLPVGYSGFEQTPAVDAKAVSLGGAEILPPGSAVAGKPLSHWLQKYWEWGRGAEASMVPAADIYGARCADRQSGPVWFLTGSFVTTTVTRNCDIPAGVHVLVPILNSLAQPDAPNVQCDGLTQALREFGGAVDDLHFSVNQRALRDPTLYRAGTGCFSFNDVSNKVNGLAAGEGYWVVLKPLLPGRYEIAFGGRFVTDGFTQNVRYTLNVK